MLAGHTVLGGSLPSEWTDLNLLSRLEVGGGLKWVVDEG
jgi:hypothetical protein